MIKTGGPDDVNFTMAISNGRRCIGTSGDDTIDGADGNDMHIWRHDGHENNHRRLVHMLNHLLQYTRCYI